MFENIQEIESVGQDIFLYRNFLSEEESDHIVNFLENLDESNWHFDTLPDRVEKFKLAHEVDLLKPVREKISFLLDKDFFMGKKTIAIRMTKGMSWGIHSDVHRFNDVKQKSMEYIEGTPFDEYPLTFFGTVVYLNQFDGGEIIYPGQNIEIKPNKGDLVIHGAYDSCAHGVKPVLSDKRYTYSSFIFKKVKVPQGSVE